MSAYSSSFGREPATSLNVPAMMHMLEEIQTDITGDQELKEFAHVIGEAISTLARLRQTAHSIMLEAEAERMLPGERVRAGAMRLS